MARVLLVEDEPVLADLLREVLGQGGHDVRVVHTVADAIAELERAIPDIVVSDFLLPDRTGLDFGRHVRASVRNPPPVLLVTAYLEPSLQEEIEEEPAIVEVVRKPLDVFAFRSLVAGHVARNRDAPDPGPPGDPSLPGESEPPDGPSAMGVASI